MENNAVIKCANMKDDSQCTVISLRYKLYLNDTGKVFGRLLVLKHKVESFLKEVLDEEIVFQNPLLQRTKDGLLDLFEGLSTLCSAVSPSREVLQVPELPASHSVSSYEMKFIKGTSPGEMWLCYVDNGEFLNVLKRLNAKYENNELEPFVFYPPLGEHVYFKNGQNIFRGIVQEYVVPENSDKSDNEERMDVKVLNIDNSDVSILPRDCFFKLDKDGIEVPMQCVLCLLDEQNETTTSDPSVATLKKNKLSVTFSGKTVPIKGLPVEAQCVTIDLSSDKSTDTKNPFNVNSKEFVPRSCIVNEVAVPNTNANCEKTNDQNTRTASSVSSQDERPAADVKENETSSAVNSPQDSSPPLASSPTDPAKSEFDSRSPAAVESSSLPPSKMADKVKDNKTIDKTKTINSIYSIKGNNSSSSSSSSLSSSSAAVPNTTNVYRPGGGGPHPNNKEYRYNPNWRAGGDTKSSNSSSSKSSSSSLVSGITDLIRNANVCSPSGSINLYNETRAKSGPPSVNSHPSQTPLPANLPCPNPGQTPPYLYQSVPQFPTTPMHFPSATGQYVPIPSPQQLNSSMPFHFPQYPYGPAVTGAYLPSAAMAAAAAIAGGPPPPGSHTQATAVSSPYQSYMHPVAVGPFFSSQPPFPQQFYQPTAAAAAAASHLQPTWSHLQPSFHVSGGSHQPLPQQMQSAGGKGDIANSPGLAKYK